VIEAPALQNSSILRGIGELVNQRLRFRTARRIAAPQNKQVPEF
jgi:hypothetical protein